MKSAILLAVALAALQASSPAWGHEARPRGETPTHAVVRTDWAQPPRPDDRPDSSRTIPPGVAPEAPLPEEAARALPLGVLVLTALACLARRRRSLALTLAATLVILAFESGLHSVHHLDSPTDAARCAVAATATHTPGLLGDTAANPVGPGLSCMGVLVVAEARPVPGLPRAFQSRAPPFPSPARA